MNLENVFLKEAQELLKEVITHRRHLHQTPELEINLPKTTEYVANELKKLGYEPKQICESGLTATIGKPGKTILLRADMDALPIQEETDLEFKSTNGCMHACGHDCHTAMLLGVAKMLKSHENELEGTVKLMFQPGEEVMRGGKLMVDSGVLENPKVDVAMATHIFSMNPPGKVLVKSGSVCASNDIFRITIQGKGCHGAMPHMGIDPINAASHIVLNLQTINSRENDPVEALVVTIGKFDGGYASNIIPDKVVLEGTIRTFKNDVRIFAKKRTQEIVEKTAELFNTSAKFEFLDGAPPLVVNEDFLNEITPSIKKVTGEDGFAKIDDALMGSEDFAYVAEKVPSAFLMLTAPTQEPPYPQHHPKVDFKEDMMPTSMATMVQCVVDWLKNNK